MDYAFDPDSTVVPIEDFNYAQFDPPEPEPEPSGIPGWSAERLASAADSMGVLLGWLVASFNGRRKCDPAIVGRKTVLLAYLIRPANFPHIRSLSKLASEMGISKQALSRFSVELRDLGQGRFVHAGCRAAAKTDSLISQAFEDRKRRLIRSHAS